MLLCICCSATGNLTASAANRANVLAQNPHVKMFDPSPIHKVRLVYRMNCMLRQTRCALRRGCRPSLGTYRCRWTASDDWLWLHTMVYHGQSEDIIRCPLQGFAVLTITPKHATSTWCVLLQNCRRFLLLWLHDVRL